MSEARGPQSELEIANGAYLQYIETGDDCYICNLTPDEMRAFIRDLGDTDRAKNAARPGRGQRPDGRTTCRRCGTGLESGEYEWCANCEMGSN